MKRNPRPIQLDIDWINVHTEEIYNHIFRLLNSTRRTRSIECFEDRRASVSLLSPLGGTSPSYNQNKVVISDIVLESRNDAKTALSYRLISGGRSNPGTLMLKLNGTADFNRWEDALHHPELERQLKWEIKSVLAHELSHLMEFKQPHTTVDPKKDYVGYYNSPHEIKSRQFELIVALDHAFHHQSTFNIALYKQIFNTYSIDQAVYLIPELSRFLWGILKPKNLEYYYATIYQWLKENKINLRRSELRKWDLPLSLQPKMVLSMIDLIVECENNLGVKFEWDVTELKNKGLEDAGTFILFVSEKGLEVFDILKYNPTKDWFFRHNLQGKTLLFNRRHKGSSSILMFLYNYGNFYPFKDIDELHDLSYLGNFVGVPAKLKDRCKGLIKKALRDEKIDRLGKETVLEEERQKRAESIAKKKKEKRESRAQWQKDRIIQKAQRRSQT